MRKKEKHIDRAAAASLRKRGGSKRGKVRWLSFQCKLFSEEERAGEYW
jgi:hypothetical protein